MKGVTLVFPAYNEAARLPALLTHLSARASSELAAAGLRLEQVVLADDGSTDGTRALIAEAARSDERITAVSGPHRGKGAAIRAGIGEARAELVLLVDVDLSTPLGDAGALWRAMQASGARIAIGSRDVVGAKVDAPLHRRIMGMGFNLGVRALTGLRYADTQSGLKLAETALARELLAEQIASGFAFDVELLMRARLADEQVAEAPVSYVHDDGSKVRVLGSSTEMAADVLRLSLRLGRAGRAARRIRRPEASPRA